VHKTIPGEGKARKPKIVQSRTIITHICTEALQEIARSRKEETKKQRTKERKNERTKEWNRNNNREGKLKIRRTLMNKNYYNRFPTKSAHKDSVLRKECEKTCLKAE
jgi:hypothetical protein